MTSPGTPTPNYATPPSGGGGMPKWLMILLVVLLLIILGCCGGFATCTYLARRAVNAVPAVVQQQMQNQGVTVNANGGAIDMPADFPADLPVYQGMKPVSSVTPPGTKSGTVTFTGTAAPAEMSAFYRTQMAQKGWTPVLNSADADGFNQHYTKDKRFFHVSGSGKAGDSTLMLTYGDQ